MGESMRAAATGAGDADKTPRARRDLAPAGGVGVYSLRVQTWGISRTPRSATPCCNGIWPWAFITTSSMRRPLRLPAQRGAETPDRTVLVRDSEIVRTGSESGVVVAVPILERFSIGGSLKVTAIIR